MAQFLLITCDNCIPIRNEFLSESHPRLISPHRPFQVPARWLAVASAVLILGASSLHAQPGSGGALSREERLKQHRERIAKILEERRKQEGTAAPGAGTAATPGAAAATSPGAAAQGAATGPVAGTAGAVERPGSNVPPATGVPGMPGNPVGAPGSSAPSGQGTARTEARSILALFPFDSSVRTGDTFETEIIADVRTGLSESVSFTMSWPPDDLNPLALNHNALAAMGVKEFEYGIDPEKGILSARIAFPKPVALMGQALLSITWEGLRPAQAAQIEFRFDGEVPTVVKSGGENVLGTAFAPDDGILHSVVLIRPRVPMSHSARTAEGGIIMGGPESQVPAASIRLAMDIDKPSLRTGDAAVVTVSLSNPEKVPFDRVRLYLQYDPARLEVLDTDRGNAIKTGVNIREPERQQFPFDFLRSNLANPKNGWIELDAGTESRTVETTGGILAQVAFRALRSGPAEVTLVRNSAGLAPTTDIHLNGVTVLEALPPAPQPTALAGVRLNARGPQIRTQQALDNEGSMSSTNASTVLFSSGLAKQRQFGTVQLPSPSETSVP